MDLKNPETIGMTNIHLFKATWTTISYRRPRCLKKNKYNTSGYLSIHYHTKRERIQGMLAVYVDDTLAAGNDEFMKLTDKIPEQFESKPREFAPFIFSGVIINNDRLGYFLEQK